MMIVMCVKAVIFIVNIFNKYLPCCKRNKVVAKYRDNSTINTSQNNLKELGDTMTNNKNRDVTIT